MPVPGSGVPWNAVTHSPGSRTAPAAALPRPAIPIERPMTDPEAKAWFGRNVEECMDSLYGLALRLTRNGADAEDLVADSVAKAWSAIGSLEDRSRFRPWLLRIVHNGFVSDYRRKAVRPVQFAFDEVCADADEDDITTFLMDQPDDFLRWWGNPEREFVNKLMGEDIVSAIEKLPETFRLAVVLVTVEGLSYDEAAEVLGVPPGTIRSRMKRGRTLLQKALWRHARDAGLIDDDHAGDCRT